jgi:hypothetical protein
MIDSDCERRQQRATVGKLRFEQVMAALLSVGKDEVTEIMEDEKKARSRKKRARKPKA